MIDVIIDTIIDCLKLLPFLLVTFLLIELIEHKFQDKSKKIIRKSGKFGPLLGGVLGLFPQCGFSVMATNFYITKIITLGTLVSIYLSTSDEMLPILLASSVSTSTIINILGIKLVVGILFGMIIDIFIKSNRDIDVHDMCESEHCHCDEGIFKSSINHTLHTVLFIFITTFIINTLMYYGGEEYLRSIFHKSSIFTPFIAGLIGLIPNCCSSIILTELYLSGILGFSSLIAGLLSGSGVAILVLFRNNKNIKENLIILLMVYLISVSVGIILTLFNILF